MSGACSMVARTISPTRRDCLYRCQECRKMQLQRAQPLIPSKLPDLPWQKVGMDLFEWRKNNYLLIVNYYSRFMEVSKLSRTTAEEVITHTKSIFARHGIPKMVVSDNGPQKNFGTFPRTTSSSTRPAVQSSGNYQEIVEQRR